MITRIFFNVLTDVRWDPLFQSLRLVMSLGVSMCFRCSSLLARKSAKIIFHLGSVISCSCEASIKISSNLNLQPSRNSSFAIVCFHRNCHRFFAFVFRRSWLVSSPMFEYSGCDMAELVAWKPGGKWWEIPTWKDGGYMKLYLTGVFNLGLT